ncbi:hypothetical protein [Ramlibacter sp.]|nr:hypothetical protein [Ramlibacter sp.]MDB5956961.1 hypothetical protein [Ramlibacter sp.]
MKISPDANTQAQVDIAITIGIGMAGQKNLDGISSDNVRFAELKDREHA